METSKSNSNFLEVESKPVSLLNIIGEADSEFDFNFGVPDVKVIKPEKGFCVKAKMEDNAKIFINLCHSEAVPAPPECFDPLQIIKGKSNEESLFRFPMSLGELHTELDKSNNKCQCYDVVINSEYYKKVDKNPAIRDFIMTLACSALERKYDLNISIETCILLNKPYHGNMPVHFIRDKPVDSADATSVTVPSKIVPGDDVVFKSVEESDLIKPSKVQPIPKVSYCLFRSPASGSPSFIILQGKIKGYVNHQNLSVVTSKKRIVVRYQRLNVLIDVNLPFSVYSKKSLANFRDNRLIVVAPIMNE